MSDLQWQKGQQIHGFNVQETTPLPELNATLLQLRHQRTGARLVHLAAADDNNLFAVGFHTTPADSTGVAHILEHTVLCGSRHYPVRDPFFAMLKRSLNTFMNALTASDWTLYPFATQNKKDFYNLMAVYLDAAFFPLLRERDFRQEGHRLEFADPDDPASLLQFKGVVYNEMKGAMADPSSLLGQRLQRALYPTTTYGQNSGGEPSDIPNLTHEDLKAFHATYYHPANAYFFTYGNLPLERHLEAIERLALRHFEPLEVDSTVPDELRYAAPRQVTETFSVDPGESAAGRSMVQVAWLACKAAESFERTALSALSVLLLGNPAAPLYKALLDSKLGQNIAPGAGYHDENRETFFAAGLQGTDPEKAVPIEQLILDTLAETARSGFPKERIEAALHQMEFAHREVTGDHYPYPLQLLMRLFGPWIHSSDPVSPLLLGRDLEKIRHKVEEGPFFEGLIRRYLLDNPHRVTLLLKPDPRQKEREEKEIAARLEHIRAGLTDAEKQQIIHQARELKKAQEAEEDLSVLPTLTLADIPPEERRVDFDLDRAQDVDIYRFDQPTNGIGYFTAHLEVSDLPAELRPYLPLFGALLPQVGAAGYSWQQMAERMAAATGGIRAGAAILQDPEDLLAFRPVLEVKAKALVRNQERMFDILKDLFAAPDFTDLSRLHTVISQVKISLENAIPGSGHSFAARAAAGRLTPSGRLREEWAGLSQVRLVRQVADKKPEELGEIASKLQTLAGLLFDRKRLACAVTVEGKSFAAFREGLDLFLAALAGRREAGPAAESPFTPRPAAAGYVASVPVCYVARVFRTIPFTHPDAAGLMVLAKLLRSGFLHREIREKGGAYGGLAGCDPEAGLLSLLSYRDPHLVRTLRIYEEAAAWAAAGRFTDQQIEEAILAVFSDLDRPLSPRGKGYREFICQRQGLTVEMRRDLRHRALAVDRAALTALAQRYLLEGWDASAVGVIAGEEALQKANQELREERLEVERI